MTCSSGITASQGAEASSEQIPPNYTSTASKLVLRKLTLATATGPEGPASKGRHALLTFHALFRAKR